MNNFFPKNHRAQIGETLTWVVATIVIIVVLSLSILVSINIFDDKEFKVERNSDLLVMKSLTGYLLTEKDGEKVFDLIKSDEKIKDFEGNLALQVFDRYNEEYDDIWFGINFEGFGLRKNDYFGLRPSTRTRGDISVGWFRQSVLLNVKLNLDKNLELFLVGGKNEK